MTEISPKMVDGEPICSGMGCYLCPECEYWVAEGAGKPCVPALREQRDELKAKLEAVREWAAPDPMWAPMGHEASARAYKNAKKEVRALIDKEVKK